MLRRACVVCAKVKTRKPPLLQIGNHLGVANSARVFERGFASSSDDGGDDKKDGKGKKSKVRGFPLPTRHEGGKDDKFISFEPFPERIKTKRSRPDTPKKSDKPTIKVVVVDNQSEKKSNKPDRPQGEASVGSETEVPNNSEPPASEESKVISRRRPDTPKSKVTPDTVPDEPLLEVILKLLPDEIAKKIKIEQEPEKKSPTKTKLYGIDVLYQEINKTKLKPRPDDPGSKIDAKSKPRPKKAATRDRDVIAPSGPEPTTFMPVKRQSEVTTRPRPDKPDEGELKSENETKDDGSGAEAKVGVEADEKLRGSNKVDSPPNRLEPTTCIPETEADRAARMDEEKKVWPAHERVEAEESPRPEPEADRKEATRPRPDTPQNSASDNQSESGGAAPDLKNSPERDLSEVKDGATPAESGSSDVTAETNVPDAEQNGKTSEESGDLGTNFYCGKTKASAKLDESGQTTQPKDKTKTRPRPDTAESLTEDTAVSVQQEENDFKSLDPPFDKVIVRAYSEPESALVVIDESAQSTKEAVERSRPETPDKSQLDELKTETLKLNPGPYTHEQPHQLQNNTTESVKTEISESVSSIDETEASAPETESQPAKSNLEAKPSLQEEPSEQLEGVSPESSVRHTEDKPAKDEQETPGKSMPIQEKSSERNSQESSVDLGENFYDDKTKTEQSFERKCTQETSVDLGVNFYDSSVDRLAKQELAEEQQAAYDPVSEKKTSVQSNTVKNSRKTRPRPDTPQRILESKEKAQSETSVDDKDNNNKQMIYRPKLKLILSKQEHIISSNIANTANITPGVNPQNNKKESSVDIGENFDNEKIKVEPSSEENSKQEDSVDLGENFYNEKTKIKYTFEKNQDSSVDLGVNFYERNTKAEYAFEKKQDSSVDLGVNFYDSKKETKQTLAGKIKQENSVEQLVKQETPLGHQIQDNSNSEKRSSLQSAAGKSSKKTRPRPDTPQRSTQEEKKQDSLESEEKAQSEKSVDEKDGNDKN